MSKGSSKQSSKRSSVRRVDGVLIVGGGYAGVHAGRVVRRAGRRATIVDPTGRHDFVTRLAAVAGGTAPRSDASADLAGFADEVVTASVVNVEDGIVEIDGGQRLRADALVVAAGAVPVSPPVPGLEHARPLRTADDALSLRSEIAGSSAVVIVGGGATGVQLAGAIAARHRGVAVTVIDSSDRLLEGIADAVGSDAERILRERNVDVRLGANAESITSEGVVVGGAELTGLPVWAAGFDARAGVLGLPTDESGSAAVGPDLLVDGWERTFAAGDVARHVDRNGDELAMSAQIAVQAGEAAGANAVRLLDGKTPNAAELDHVGWVLDLGGRRGLAEIAGVSLSAPFLDLLPPLLHWGIDLKHLIETRGLAGLADAPTP